MFTSIVFPLACVIHLTELRVLDLKAEEAHCGALMDLYTSGPGFASLEKERSNSDPHHGKSRIRSGSASKWKTGSGSAFMQYTDYTFTYFKLQKIIANLFFSLNRGKSFGPLVVLIFSLNYLLLSKYFNSTACAWQVPLLFTSPIFKVCAEHGGGIVRVIRTWWCRRSRWSWWRAPGWSSTTLTSPSRTSWGWRGPAYPSPFRIRYRASNLSFYAS